MEYALGILGFAMLVVIVGTCVYFANYNHLVHVRNEVREADGVLATHLQKRHETMPDIVRAVLQSQRLQDEDRRAILEVRERIAKGDSVDFGKQMELDNDLSSVIAKAFSRPRPPHTIADNNPQRATDTFIEAMKIQASTEKDVAAARTLQQATIAAYNTALIRFPASLVASSRGFAPLDYHKVSAEVARRTDVWK